MAQSKSRQARTGRIERKTMRMEMTGVASVNDDYVGLFLLNIRFCGLRRAASTVFVAVVSRVV
jgi:hypothetical protein